MVIFSWLGLAILACLSISFWPFAVLFLCPPIIAALFEREMILEALVLSLIIAAVMFYAHKSGALPPSLTSFTSALGAEWSRLAALLGTVALTLASLYSSTQSRVRLSAFQTLPAAAASEVSDILDNLPGGILRIGSDKKIHFVSRMAYDMFGLPKDAGHLTLHAITPHDPSFRDDVSELITQASQTGKPLSHGLVMYDKDTATNLDITVTPEHGGFLVHAVDTSARDGVINDLRVSQADLHRSIDDKTLFFSGVSHELRTPLNAIIGFSDMMRSRLFGPLPGKYAEYADLIHDSGQHMLDLIGDVLDMSKVDAGKYTLSYGAFDMADVARSTVKMIRPSADAAEVSVSVNIATDRDLIIEADRKAVRQILLNLLSNAIKFTPKGGAVTLSAKSLADTLHINVSDNGMGMSAEELARVGLPYTQTSSAARVDARGSGLGLSLVKSLVDLHHGRFAIASQPEAGTSVDIYLPLNAVRGTSA